MGDNIKVVVKVRPLIKRELQDKLPCLWQVDDNSIYHISNDGKNQRFTFDKVYDQNTEISDVYNDIAKPIVESATAGINGTIFAYGQTSSGKTFTMMGEEKAPGIIPQAIYNIFENIQNNPYRDYLLRVSYIEIYNEKIKDLLDVEKKDIKICETPQGGIKVEASEFVTNSPQQVLEIMNKGVQNRHIGSTNMNEQSSRSHTIFQIIIESKHHAKEDEEQDGCVNVSQLNLVDLAGSERSGQTGATGQRFKEGTHINKSLLSLGLVIKQLSEDPHKFVNYRDSKLTRILQNSLGGNAKTSIICAVTPAAFDETISTLQFANRAKAVKNAPVVNAVATDATMLATLMKKLSQLQYELESKKHLEEDNKQLTQKIRSLQNKIVHGEMVPQGWQASNSRRQTWCAPRRLTTATIPGTAGLMGPPKTVRPALPVYVTPSLERCPPRSNVATRKPSVLSNDDVSFAITEDFKEMDMSPRNTPALKKPKKHMRKSVKFSDEVIDLEAEEISKSDTSTCSPDHKCYSTTRTPPCKLRSRVQNAEKELSELIELTSLEKMYPPTEVELISQAHHLAAKVFKLEGNSEKLMRDLQTRDGQIATLEKQIDDCQKVKNKALSDLAIAQDQCASLNDKLNDLENQKVKARNREMELLSELEKSGNNPALSAGDNCRNDINQVSMLSQFIDLSKDVSLVNNSAIDESMVNEHSKSNNFMNIQITNLEMQLDEKNKIIAELNEKLSNDKKIMTTLREECLEKTDKLDLLVEKLSAETTTKAKMSEENSELHKRIASLEALLENASKDVQCYSQMVLDMQQSASRSDTSTTNPIITENGLSEIIRVRQRLTKNNEELQASIESFKASLNQKDAELRKKDETIELISARAYEYAELLDQKHLDFADVENERLQLLDQISDQAKVAYNLEVTLFEAKQKMNHKIKMLQDENESILQEKAQLSKELNVVVLECQLYREKIEAIELIVSEKDGLISKLNDEISNLKDNVERKEGELQRYKVQIDDFNQMTSKTNNQDNEPCCDGSCEIRILEIKDIFNKTENVLRREIEKLSNQYSTSPELQASSRDCIKADFESNSELIATKKILETTNTEMKILQTEINNATGTVAKLQSTIQRLEQECLCKDHEIEKLTKINTEINTNNAVLDNDLKIAKQDLNDNRRVIKGLEESLCGAKDATLKQIEVNKNIYDAQLSKSEEVIHNLTLEMSKKQDTIKLNSVKIHRLEAELKETVDKLEKCKLEVDSVNTTVQKITNKLSEKEVQLGQSLQKCEECVAEIKRLNIIISDMGNVKPQPDQTALQEALQQSKNYKIEIELLLTKADEMALKLSEKEARLGQLDYEYSEALDKIETYNTDIHKLNLTIEKQKEIINAYEISSTKVNIRDNDFQETLDKCTEQSQEIIRLNDAVRDLGEKLLENEDLIKIKDNEIGVALEKGAHFDSIIKKLKSNLDEVNRKLSEKELSIAEMSDEILERVLEKYKLENEKLHVIISDEKNKVFEIEKTSNERDNREKQLQNTLEKCKISDVEVARLNGIIKDLTSKFNEQETIVLVNNDSKLQKAIDNCKKFELLNESLTNELESKSAELAEKERDLTGLREVIDKHEQEYKKLKETLGLKMFEFKKIESAFIESNKKDEQLRKALEKFNECASEIHYLKTVLREMAVKLSDREVDLGEGDELLKVHGAIEKCTKCDSEIEQLNAKLDQLNTKLTEKKLMLTKMSEEDDALQESLIELKNCDLEVEKLKIIVDEKPPQVSHEATSAWTKNVGEQLLSALEKCTKYEVEIDNLNSIITEMTAKLDMQGDRKSDLTQESSEIDFEIYNEKEDSFSSGTGQTTESTYRENLKQYELHINEYKSQVEELQLSNSDMAALLDLLTNENLMFESKFVILQSENEGLRTNNKYLTELNEELTNEISEAEEQVVFLMESIKQLQARIVWHRMNVSTLTATSNTENKLLRSKLISAQHHHNRLHTLCQREVAEMKLQLENLHVLMQSEMSYYQSPYKQAFSMVHKRDLGRNYLSTPTNASFNVTQSEYASFIDDASFTSDMLMLQTNVSINVDDTSAKVAHNDITLIDSAVKSKSYINASCQTESPKTIDCRKKLEYCTLNKTDATCQTDDIYEKLQNECSELQQKCEVFSKNNEKMILSLKQAKKEKEEIQEENDSLSNDIMDRLTELDTLKEEIVEYKKEISVLKNKEIHEDRAPSKLINAKGTQTSLDLPLNVYDQGDYTALKHEVCALKLELTEVLNARDILLVKLEQINHLENKNASSQTNNDSMLNTSSKNIVTNRISKIKCELDASKEECCKITNELATMKSYIHDSEETSKKMCQELENSFKIVNLQENLDIQNKVSYEDQNCLYKENISKVKDCGSEKDERNYNQLQKQNLNLQRTVENLRIDLTKSSEQCDNLSKEKMEIQKLCERYIANLYDNVIFSHTNMNTVETLNSLIQNMDAKYKNEAENLQIQFNTLRDEKFKIEKKIAELTKDNEKYNLALMEKTNQCSKLTTNINDLSTRLGVLQSEFDLKQKTENEIKNKCGEYILQFVEEKALNSTLNVLQLIDMLVTSVCNRYSSEGKKIILERESQLNEVFTKYKLLSNELEDEKQKYENLEKLAAKLQEMNKSVTLDNVRYKQEIDGQHSLKSKLELNYQNIVEAFDEIKNELKTEKITLSKMMEENKRITGENVKLNNEISILKSNLIESKQNVETLTNSLTEACNDSKNLKEHFIRDLNILQVQIKDLEKEMINLKNLNNVLCDQNKKAADQLNACESARMKNLKDMAAMSEEIGHLKALLEEKTMEVTHQLKINSQLRLNSQQSTDNEDALGEELKKKCMEVEALTVNNSTLNKSNNILTSILSRLNAETESLKLQLSEQSQKYEDETNKYKKELKKLQEQLELNSLEVRHGALPNLEIVEPKVAARKKRQSWHDQSRLSNEYPQSAVSNDSDSQTIAELQSENLKLNAVIAELRDKAVQLEKLEFDLETSKGAMGYDLNKFSEETIPKSREQARISDCTPRTRRQSLHDQSRIALPDVRSIGTNTIQGFDSDLLSMVVDRMTFEAQLERNRTLQQQVENLRERNRQLSAELRRHTNAASVSMDGEQIQQDLEQLRRENEDLQVRLKEVDEECEICAQYLRQKEKDYDNLREIKIGLEKRVAELEGKSELEEPRNLILTTRKRRQSIHDQSRSQLSSTTTISPDGADRLRSELTKKQREVQDLKEMVVDLRNQIDVMQVDKNTSGGENVARAGSAIVQNQKISDYIAEMCRLRRVNAKLVNLCKKRGKEVDSDGNIINVET